MTEKWQYIAVDNIYHDVSEIMNLDIISWHHYGHYSKFMSKRFRDFIGWTQI